jgi:hydrogenase expression/formation protein HypC
MCLAIPGKVMEFHQTDGLRMSRVDFGGVSREACLEYLPEAAIGDYVLVHAGFAISRVDPDEASRTLRLLEEMGQLDEAP